MIETADLTLRLCLSTGSPSLRVNSLFVARPFISSLFGIGSPPTVLRRVQAIVVYAIKGMDGTRPQPHIGIEVLKPSPALTYRDPAPAVASETAVVRVEASLEHPSPNGELRRFRKAVGLNAGTELLDPQTAATPASSCAQRVRQYNDLIATGTSTKPTSLALSACFGSRAHRKPAELHTEEVNSSCHGKYLIRKKSAVHV